MPKINATIEQLEHCLKWQHDRMNNPNISTIDWCRYAKNAQYLSEQIKKMK